LKAAETRQFLGLFLCLGHNWITENQKWARVRPGEQIFVIQKTKLIGCDAHTNLNSRSSPCESTLVPMNETKTRFILSFICSFRSLSRWAFSSIKIIKFQ